MQNRANQPCASSEQAAEIIDRSESEPNNFPEINLKTTSWQGQGARAQNLGALRVELDQLALRYGRARSRRLGALSGHWIDGEELAEIYHASFARAAAVTDSAPDFAQPGWQEALATAQREADAVHYAQRRDSRRTVSVDSFDDAAALDLDDSAAFRIWSARSCRRGSLRRLVRHGRECLIAHWSLSGRRTWRAALADDLARLATLARVHRGASFGEFGEYGDFNSSAARKSFQRLAARMASGDLIMTDNPAAAQRSIDLWHAWRARGEN